MAFVIGAHQTPFRRDSGRTHAELAADAIGGALADAGLEPGEVDAVWFGSATVSRAHPTLGGRSVVGGALPVGAPVVAVEAACATGGLALHGAWLAVRAGAFDTVVVVGVDLAPPADGAIALLDAAVYADGAAPTRNDRERFGRRQARGAGDAGWAPSPERPVLVDVAALEARFAVRANSVSKGDLAAVVVKSRANGAHNDAAWLRAPIAHAAVLAEPAVLSPFTRPMVCGLVDGAAAVVITSELGLARRPSRARAVRLSAVAIGGGSWRTLGQRPTAAETARRALALAGTPADRIDVAEVHDATAYAELKAWDAFGWGTVAEAAAATRSGATAPSGTRAINPSGGLLSRGHAFGATGVAQITELVRQLRGEAGERQVRNQGRLPRIGAAMNGGGLVGLDDAVTVVSVVQAG